jgi:hypothetical protein
MRPENITISGIKFALSNHNIRKTLQTVYNLKLDRSRYNKDQFTQNDKNSLETRMVLIFRIKICLGLGHLKNNLDRQQFPIKDAAMIAARLSHTHNYCYIGDVQLLRLRVAFTI